MCFCLQMLLLSGTKHAEKTCIWNHRTRGSLVVQQVKDLTLSLPCWGGSCGMGSLPCLGTFTCCKCSQKKRKKRNNRTSCCTNVSQFTFWKHIVYLDTLSSHCSLMVLLQLTSYILFSIFSGENVMENHLGSIAEMHNYQESESMGRRWVVWMRSKYMQYGHPGVTRVQFTNALYVQWPDAPCLLLPLHPSPRIHHPWRCWPAAKSKGSGTRLMRHVLHHHLRGTCAPAFSYPSLPAVTASQTLSWGHTSSPFVSLQQALSFITCLLPLKTHCGFSSHPLHSMCELKNDNNHCWFDSQ